MIGLIEAYPFVAFAFYVSLSIVIALGAMVWERVFDPHQEESKRFAFWPLFLLWPFGGIIGMLVVLCEIAKQPAKVAEKIAQTVANRLRKDGNGN